MTWGASTDNVGVTGYRVYRGATLVGSPTATSYSDTGLAPSTAYSYTVKAVDAAGNLSAASNTASATTLAAADTTPPSARHEPRGHRAASSTQINLTWAASTDNVGVTGYRVYRGATLVGSPTTTSYSDTGLTPSTAYSYTVKAADAAGNLSAASNTASATTLEAPVATGLDAAVVSTAFPSWLAPGSHAEVSVTMRNAGAEAWTEGSGFALGAQNPAANTRWGRSATEADGIATVLPGQEVTFSFDITAPAAPGAYTCDWQMVTGTGESAETDDAPALPATATWFGPVVQAPIDVTTFSDIRPSYWAGAQIEAAAAGDDREGVPRSHLRPYHAPDQRPDGRLPRHGPWPAATPACRPWRPAPPSATCRPRTGPTRTSSTASRHGVAVGYRDGYLPRARSTGGRWPPPWPEPWPGATPWSASDPDGAPSFPDVPTDSWAYKYIEYCYARGIVQGYWDGFHPEGAVTRTSMAAFVARAFGLMP